MRVQERIRAIRLITKTEKNKKYAAQVGIEANLSKNLKEANKNH